jgi:hypothetical protein
MADEFLNRYHGLLYGVLSWEQLDRLWQAVDPRAGWYLYAVGEALPASSASGEETLHFIQELDALLRREHDEDYCGIVYADDLQSPGLIKVFDPGRLGSSCGGKGGIPPGWILSRWPPAAMDAGAPVMAARRRWWQGLFGNRGGDGSA